MTLPSVEEIIIQLSLTLSFLPEINLIVIFRSSFVSLSCKRLVEMFNQSEYTFVKDNSTFNMNELKQKLDFNNKSKEKKMKTLHSKLFI